MSSGAELGIIPHFRGTGCDIVRLIRGLKGFFEDLKHSGRMFLESPGFTAVVIAALALGIGVVSNRVSL